MLNKKEDKSGTIFFQIINLQNDIKKLKEHLSLNKKVGRKGNEKDIPAKRALLKKVAKTRRFLKYLAKKDLPAFQKIKRDF